MKDRRRLHRFIFRFFYAPVSLFYNCLYRLSLPKVWKDPRLPEHFLMISNHACNDDALFLALAFKHQMYFVVTEHLLSLGFVSKLLQRYLDPIPRPKAAGGAGAVMEILRRLKGGSSVCLFAEGNCSWDGRTASFPEATGKMALRSGVPLVTFRLSGNYFAFPRWTKKRRRGPVTGELVNVYSPEELKALGPKGINEAVRKDIGLDAYENQKASPERYPSRRAAEGIEHLLVVCPACRGIDTLRSKGRTFSCSCGLSGTYSDTAFLSGNGFSFKTAAEWSDWQKEYIETLPATEEELTADEGMILREINGHERSDAASGRLSMSGTALSIGDLSFPLSEIAEMAVRMQGTVNFSLNDGRYFELIPPKKTTYHGYKYFLLYQHFQGGAQ